jgi:ABC-2 type transport system ATP-binding protein
MQILRELQRRGKTIFISSHILSDLSDLCDSVTVMDRGVVRYNGALQGLLHETGNRELQTWILTVTQSDASVHQALTRLPGVVSVINDSKNPFRLVMTIRHQEVDPGALLACALAAGAKIREFHEEQRHLNQAFMDLTQAGVRA